MKLFSPALLVISASQAVLGAPAINTTVEALAIPAVSESHLALANVNNNPTCRLLNRVVRTIGTSHITYDNKRIVSFPP